MSGVMLNKDERGIRTDESVNMSDWKIKKKKNCTQEGTRMIYWLLGAVMK
jgi:hypothetical protein